ncbi:MAG: hypothetical protein GC190_17575 [Alphaproteobacteria bacterium]|nr:hypothetical protein [Alphaproteobacteria bacterium]
MIMTIITTVRIVLKAMTSENFMRLMAGSPSADIDRAKMRKSADSRQYRLGTKSMRNGYRHQFLEPTTTAASGLWARISTAPPTFTRASEIDEGYRSKDSMGLFRRIASNPEQSDGREPRAGHLAAVL